MKFLFLHPMTFKTSCQSVLYERDDVWTSVHCLKQVLGDQAGWNKIDLYQEKELFRTRWQPKIFPFLWFSFFELSCFIFLNLLTSGWCLWGSAPVLTVLGDMDGVLIDVWTSVHCLEQDLGHQAGLNKSCSRRLGRKNSNRHMPLWLRLYKKKSFQTVLDDLEQCMGVVDGIDMILKYVWRCLHCLHKILATRPDLIYSQRVEVPFSASNGFQNFMPQCSKWTRWCMDVSTLFKTRSWWPGRI